MVTPIHTENQHGDQTRTIPLATHAGTDRWAIVMASWQGAGHGSGDMGTGSLGPLTVQSRLNRSAGFVPGLVVYAGQIPGGTSDATLDINHGGCGWALYVLDVDTVDLTVSQASTGFGTTFSVNSAGYDGLAIGHLSTNANSQVTASGGLTGVMPSVPYYSDTSTGWATPGVNGSLTWGSDSDWAGWTVSVPTPTMVYTSTLVGFTQTGGTVVGSGLGDDITSTDANGVTDTAGEEFSVVAQMDVLPSLPTGSTGVDTEVRVTLVGGYPTDQGYEILLRLQDTGGTALSTEMSAGTIVGGETVVIASADLWGNLL